MNIKATLGLAAARLLHSSSPGLDAEVLLAHVLKKPRELVLANPIHTPRLSQFAKYNKLINRRTKGEPVAYLTGHKEFFGLDFMVNKRVLIPRPETELLVELGIQRITNQKSRIKNVIDLGTGSGCLIISLAKKLAVSNRLVYHTPHFYAVDSSTQALQIAKSNARKHGAHNKIKFLKGNLLSPLFRDSKFVIRDSLLLANLPYLTPAQYQANPDLKFEPKFALVGGKDGLKYYRELFKQIAASVSPPLQGGVRGGNSILLLEIDPSQKIKIKKLAKQYLPNAPIKFHKDLAGRWRVAEIHLLPSP